VILIEKEKVSHCEEEEEEEEKVSLQNYVEARRKR